MQINPRLFPHPVLSFFSDDVVECQYQCSVTIVPTSNAYQFGVVSRTSNKDLNLLILHGRASFALHLECPKTRFRDIYKWNTEAHKFQVPASQLDGKVHICRFIIATEDIDNYTNTNFHADYSGFSFKIKKGDILALGTTQIFDADKDFDPLRSIPSIFRIKINKDTEAAPIDIEYDSDKITVYLSEENYRLFKTLQLTKSLQPALAQFVIVPALVSILERIKVLKRDDEILEFEDKRWYKVLVKKLKEHGINANATDWPISTVALVQKLIADPLSQSLAALNSIQEDD